MTSSAPAPARQQELRNFLNGAFAGTQDGAVASIVDPGPRERQGRVKGKGRVKSKAA